MRTNLYALLCLSFFSLAIGWPVSDAVALTITGPDFTCPGSIISFSVTGQSGQASYVWSFPPNVSVVEQSGNVVTVLWGISNGNICVTANYQGGGSESDCLSVTVPPNPVTTFIDSVICSGEFLFFGGQILSQSGTYTANYSDQFGCDSTVILSLEVLPGAIDLLQKKDATCGMNNGEVELFLNAGVVPGLIHWNNGVINENVLTGLAPGTYGVTVTSGSCADDAFVTINADPFCDVRISGHVYDDQLIGACDEAEVIGGVEQLILRLEHPSGDLYTLTDQNGYFEFTVDTGTYVLELILPADRNLVCPGNASQPLTFTTPGSYSDDNHFFLDLKPLDDLSASALVPPARSGETQRYLLRFCNEGTDTASGRFVFEYDPLQTWLSSELTPSINDNIEKKSIWDLLDIPPGECFQFFVETSLDASASSGDIVKGSVHGIPISGSQDERAENDRLNWSTPVNFGNPAFEKIVFSGDQPYGQPVYSKDTLLTYQIRFWNTGQDTAYNIVVRDTIDRDLDLSTLVVNSASHPYMLEVDGLNEVRFRFTGIRLPSAKKDSLNSWGAINFSLRPRDDAEYGSLIRNRAELLVDFKPAVFSNEVVNLLSEKNLTYSGFVLTELVKPVKGVEASLSGGASQTALSNAGGAFSFQQLIPEQNYELSLSKNTGYLNGVTTFDLLQIQKHILGVEPFGSEYRKIAADINDSGSITTADIIELRKMILGILSDFPNNESWRFVNSELDIPALPPAEVYEIPDVQAFSLSGSSLQQFFIGIKLGDVTGDANPQNLQQEEGGTARDLAFRSDWVIEDRLVKAGEIIEIPLFLPEEQMIQALQFSLAFSFGELEFLGLNPEQKDRSDVCEAVVHEDGGQRILSFLWYRTASFSIEREGPLVLLPFRALRDAQLSELLHLVSGPTPALLYREGGEAGDLTLLWEQKNAELQCGEIQPNPFSDKAHLPVMSQLETNAVFSVWDGQGRQVLEIPIRLKGGEWEQIPLQASAFSRTGVYFWKVQTEHSDCSGRLTIIR